MILLSLFLFLYPRLFKNVIFLAVACCACFTLGQNSSWGARVQRGDKSGECVWDSADLHVRSVQSAWIVATGGEPQDQSLPGSHSCSESLHAGLPGQWTGLQQKCGHVSPGTSLFIKTVITKSESLSVFFTLFSLVFMQWNWQKYWPNGESTARQIDNWRQPSQVSPQM